MSRRLRDLRERQTGVGGGVGRSDFGCRQKRRDGVGQLEEGPGAQMRPSPCDELGGFGRRRLVGSSASPPEELEPGESTIACLRVQLTLQRPEVAQQLARRLIAGVGTLLEALERNPFQLRRDVRVEPVMDSGAA